MNLLHHSGEVTQDSHLSDVWKDSKNITPRALFDQVVLKSRERNGWTKCHHDNSTCSSAFSSISASCQSNTFPNYHSTHIGTSDLGCQNTTLGVWCVGVKQIRVDAGEVTTYSTQAPSITHGCKTISNLLYCHEVKGRSSLLQSQYITLVCNWEQYKLTMANVTPTACQRWAQWKMFP